MDSGSTVFYYAAGLPALISTGITFIYFVLKLCRYIADAIPHKTERGWQRPRQIVVNQNTAQIRETKATNKFVHKYRDIIQNNMAEGHEDPQGPFLYQEGGKTFASLLMGMLQGIQNSPLFEKMQKDCKAEGVKIPKTIMAKDPIAHLITPQEYLQNVEAGTMPPMNNHDQLKALAEKATADDQTKFLMMEF